jgi:hypothetical protein
LVDEAHKSVEILSAELHQRLSADECRRLARLLDEA